eukprot:GHVT01002884.1.p1 GENE.GHVT01002884.1~~GHVT01002884.1.p1  ORF type:complete len:250 (+),score=4.41 GHVT01002884.1:212-961(+)
MKTPEKVRDIVHELSRSLQIPVSVKTRIGVDHLDSFEFLAKFVETVSAGGCDHFIIHARKAWLKGVSTQRNRSVPSLDYDRVVQLAKHFPDLKFTINGGITSLEEAAHFLDRKSESIHTPLFHGTMMGRAIANNPVLLASADKFIFGARAAPATAATRLSVLENYLAYLTRVAPDALRRKSHICGADVLRPITSLTLGITHARKLRSTTDYLLHAALKGTRTLSAADLIVEAIEKCGPELQQALAWPIV